MPLDPSYDEMLRQLAALGGPSLAEVPVEVGREMFRAMQPAAPEVEVAAVTDITAGGVPARVYRPHGDGPFPVAMMFHGGGWVIGDLETADSQSREVCRGADTVVVSVDYRLAPEHRFPAAAEDCYSATLWATEHAGVHDGDPGSLAVVGDSAGGNLAAVVAQMARDRGGPRIGFQLLVYPVTDGVNFDTASYRDNAEGFLLTAEAMHWFWDHYVPVPDHRRNPYASPLLASDLSALPPALIMTAEYDPLRDEGEAYGRALADDGVAAKIVRYDGLIHGFFAHTRTIDAARGAMSAACAALRSAFDLK
ncbi:MAG: alpha/beta hydrolase [Gammaproteobacteria bacterium]|nr:alpha/beta hydrolase [Gammaproteobacteria bacterium]MDE0442347.1 alpha/beta hydrolase [Gammaproteobacteria bacterium]